MIVNRLDQLCFDDIFMELPDFSPNRRVLLKLESFQPTGSIKFKTAREIIDHLEKQRALGPGVRLVESSSGNLGVALAFLCRIRGYAFTCVVDPNALRPNVDLIRAYGGEIIRVDAPHPQGGWLQARLDVIRRILNHDSNAVWTNQYANDANAAAHERHTAPAILRNAPDVGVVAIGAGTTGTLLGCLRHFRRTAPHVRLVAADSVGSVTFGGAAGLRRLPGLGTGVRPALAEQVDQLGRPPLHMIPETDTVAMCHFLLNRYGLLAGASTGTTACALLREAQSAPEGTCLVGVSPDPGERYLDTLYNPEWLDAAFGPQIAAAE